MAIHKEKWQDIWVSLLLGMERGFSKGVDYGVSQDMIETAIKMITKFKLSIEDLAKELNISIDELKRHLQK